MEGVEILNTTYEYARLINPHWLALCLILSLLVGIAGLLTIDYDAIHRILVASAIVLLLNGVGCFVGGLIESDTIVCTKYDVIISDEVKMNEFFSKYEVIEQNGKIYTVKERE